MNFSELVKKNLEKGILTSPDLLGKDVEEAKDSEKVVVLSPEFVKTPVASKEIDWKEFDKAKVLLEKNKDPKMYKRFLEIIETTTPKEPPALQKKTEIIYSYNEPSRKRTFEDFVGYFNSRFREISDMLKARAELQRATSISRVLQKKEKSSAAIIGLIYEKSTTKNGNILLTIEDPTGFIKALVSKNKPEIFQIAKDACLDEVVGIEGTYDNILFVNNFLLPDVPLTKEYKKSPNEEYMVIVGDPQVGGKKFLEKEFTKLLLWLNGKVGNDEQKRIASKVKYAIFPGDLVEGVGVYPEQEKDLEIMDIQEQYEKFAEYLRQIPESIEIILCPGNHDAGRLAEPQPLLYKDFAKSLWEMPNVTIVSNPSIVRIGKSEGFDGFDILLYHGASMFYYAGEVDSIRSRGGILRADLIMKYFLQRRHLAPTHASTVYIPEPEKDPLVISKVPDFLITGHVHIVLSSNYRNTTLINASAWTGITENQIRRGLEPQPARLPIVNLKTREVKIMNFLGKEEAERIRKKEV